MAAGITIQKNYVSSNLTNVNLANNWMVLVLGITNQGPVTPTLVQTYASFTSTFGQPISGVPTHAYVQFLLNSGVPVLFKRIIDKSKLVTANVDVKGLSDDIVLFQINAAENYNGDVGNNISVMISQNETTNACSINVIFNGTAVETYNLGIATETTSLGDLLYTFVKSAANTSSTFSSEYITFKLVDEDATAWTGAFKTTQTYTLAGGSTPANDLTAGVSILKDYDNIFWTDRKLKNSAVYYPQLRFITTGGIISEDVDEQNIINHNLGQFATDCESSFRVLVDYSVDNTDIETPRKFAQAEASTGSVSPAMYSYFGFWGADSNNNWLPGSAGFLSALGLSGYNVYSRRIAGSSFTPAFTKAYEEIYIDALSNWQSEELVQVNPIMVIDAQDNLAVMGSSTLAMPLSSTSARNPAQALDVVLVGDYFTCLMTGIVLNELEGALDRLSLNSLSNKMSQEAERFVTSRAITRYDFTFDTTQLGKLGINCTLYFPVGLEEVSLTVTSVYDVTDITAIA